MGAKSHRPRGANPKVAMTRAARARRGQDPKSRLSTSRGGTAPPWEAAKGSRLRGVRLTRVGAFMKTH
jgi:hypothetical protein